MKKIMVAICAVALAAAVQASSVQWQAGVFPDLPDCEAFKEGGSGYTGYGDDFNGCIQAYIFESTTAYTYADGAAVWAAFQKNEISGTALTPTKIDTVSTGLLNVNGLDTYSENTPVYAAIVYVHSDTGDFDNPDYYIANVASALATPDGSPVYDLASTWGGAAAAGGSIGWQTAAVPEPTSGLLLLLGVAGLALRRRRA